MADTLTRADREAIYRECAAKGMTVAETAQMFGRGYHVIWQWAKKNPDVHFKRTHPPSQRERYKDCAAKGMTISETAIACNRSRSAVKEWAAENPEFRFAPGKIMTRWKPKSARIDPLSALTKEQRADYDLLTIQAKYSAKDALEAVTRPRAVVPLKVRRAA